MPKFSPLTKHEPKHALTDMDINFVSLCGAGRHPLANVAIFKAEPPEGDHLATFTKSSPTSSEVHSDKPIGSDEGKPCEKCGKPKGKCKCIGKSDESASTRLHTHTVSSDITPSFRKGDHTMPDTFELPEGTNPKVAEYVASLEKAVADTEDKLAEAEERLAETPVTKAEPSDDDLDSLIAKADPATAAVLRKMQADTQAAIEKAEAADRLAKAEADKVARTEALAKAESLSALGFETSEVAEVIHAVRKADAELAAKVEGLLDSANTAVEKSNLFGEVGTTAVTKAGSQIEARIAEIRKAQPELTAEQAEAQAWSETKGAYTDYLATKEA